MDVSIVIPTYNRQKQVVNLVEYLSNELDFRGPIIIVDQSDNQQSSNLNSYPNVHYYFSNEKGTSKARNFGAIHAQTDWLFFLDDDVRPVADFFEKSLRFLEKNSWIDVLQPLILQRADWESYTAAPENWLSKRLSSNAARLSPPAHLDGIQWFFSQPVAGYSASSLCIGAGAFFVNRAAFFRAGGFDEVFTGAGDDREFALRLWWFGYQIYSFPDCVAFHLHDNSGGLRQTSEKRSFSSLFKPEPDPKLLYFYHKWFPGYPTLSFYISYLLKYVKFPFKLPIKIIRLLVSIRSARKIMGLPPQYAMKRDPLPRDLLPR